MILEQVNIFNSKHMEVDYEMLDNSKYKRLCTITDTDISTRLSISKEGSFTENREIGISKLLDSNQELSRKNYYCYVEGCKCSFKYLYLFKYHLANHLIFNFDCIICGKRFLKFLEFKKHFIVHGMSIMNYKVKSKAPVHEKLSKRAKQSVSIEIANNVIEKQKIPLDAIIFDLISILKSQDQNSDFCEFDQSLMLIKDYDFPSYRSYLMSG